MHDTSQKPERPDPGYSQEDWDEVSDSPELSDEELSQMRPAREVPEIYDLLPKRGRGRPKLADAKVNLTLRVDPSVLEAYKATGAGWQTRMHDALARGVRRAGPPIGVSEASPRSGNYEVLSAKGPRSGSEVTIHAPNGKVTRREATTGRYGSDAKASGDRVPRKKA